MVKRFQCFEFDDQPWISGWVREAYMDCLSFTHKLHQPYYHLAAPILEWAKSVQALQILDIGSGHAMHIAMLLKTYKKKGITPPQFILSDLYPNTDSYRLLQKQYGEASIQYLGQPLSALDIQGVRARYWTIFTAFHHFSPPMARQLLQQLAQKGDGLCILEFFRRGFFDAFMVLLAFPLQMIAPLFAERISLRKILITTIIPIIPFIVTFDGIVSVFRSYTVDEITDMLPSESRNDFNVEYKQVRWWSMPTPLSLKSTLITITRKIPLAI